MDMYFDPIVNALREFGPRVPGAIGTFAVGYVVVRILQNSAHFALRASRVTKPMQQILMSSLSVILWAGVAALVFQSLGLNQIAIAVSGSVAIIGVGIASGANKLVSDILSGLFLARSRDFRIGQKIKVGEVTGLVHSLDARKVRIQGEDGSLYVMPTTNFDSQTWQILPEGKEEKEHERK